MEGVFVLPYGEWILLITCLITWAEKLALRRFLFWLSVTWVGGKIVEGLIAFTPLHWNVARLAVLVVFFGGAWRRSPKSLLSLIVPSVVLVAEVLLVANEPGIIPLEHWLFLGALFLTAWLASRSYWGMAAAVGGSLLFKEGFSLLVYGGLFRYQDVPEPFFWHAGAVGILLFGLTKPLLELNKENIEGSLSERVPVGVLGRDGEPDA